MQMFVSAVAGRPHNLAAAATRPERPGPNGDRTRDTGTRK
jgi:hypothetical protein